MRTLITFAMALLVARFEIAHAAPQPIAIVSTTSVADSELEIERISVGTEKDGLVISTPLTDNNSVSGTSKTSIGTSTEINDKELNDGSEDNNGDVADDRSAEKDADELTTFIENKDFTRVSTAESRSGSVTGVVTTFSSKEFEDTTDSFTGISSAKDEDVSEISISRYVPPLDPMKHMLMMEAKKKLQLSTTLKIPEVTSTFPPTSNTEVSLLEVESVTGVNDKNEKEPEAVEKLQISTINNNNANDVHPTDNYAASVFSTSSNPEQSTTNAPTTSEIFEITTQESAEIVPDINHESSILIKSSELFSGKEQEVPNAVLSTESPESTSTDVPNETSELSSSTVLVKASTTTASEISTTDIFKATEKNELVEVTNIPSLERSEDEVDATEISGSKEAEAPTTETSDILIEKERSESNESSTSATKLTTSSTSLLDLIITTISQPETTPESISMEKLLSSHGETNKNMAVGEDLEFRDNLGSLNASNVTYIGEENETINSKEVEGATNAETVITESEEETTTARILTTLKELLFSSTSIPMSSENSGEAFESDSTSFSSSAEVIKVELLKSDTDSISSSDIDTSTTVVPELDSETKLATAEQTTTTQNSYEDISSTENSQTSSESEASTSSEASNEEDTSLNSELVNSSEPESIPALYVKDSSSNETEGEKSQSFFDMNTKDRYISGNNTDTVAAVQFLHYHDKASSEQCFKLVNAHWNYATDLTDTNKKKQLEQTLEYALFHKEAWKNATSFAWKSFNDTLLRRWFKSLSVLGTAALPEDKLNEFNRLKAEMKNIYSTAKVCEYETKPPKRGRNLQKPKDCTLTLEPDLQRILTKSRDYDELTYVWQAWREVAGKPLREKYMRFVEFSNEAARLNGFSDTGDMWREAYESDTFEDDLEALWNQLKPLYENLHAYVRRRLIQEYGNDKIKDDGPIPAHLFGNMWAQSWVSLLDITQPFPGKPSVDVTPIMEAKNLSALEMFQISEEFFTSLGLKPMPEEFWKHSLIEKPKDREIICHASAWDFCNGKDYRIKQCTDITMEDLITVHHEMGHIQYFLQYARQPNVFREGANPGFHEAIGDVLALSASTPKHLQSIGLLEEVSDDPEGDLNFLLRTALDKVSFLPSGYLIDQWRWGLFSGEVKPEEMNTKWWDLRLKYQGICPPIKRHDTDFDPGAKYHVPGNVPYIRYFVSFVIQFQFHKVLCDASGHTGPLYKCDIYRSKEAGQILSQVMELGSSEHWSEAMKIMTGGDTNRMDAGPILEYFQPLLDFLKEQNKNETIGWTSIDSTICP